MAVICWGNLGKTADDNTRIEQSIQDYVEDHNENPNAHQIEGSSLYMHRINEALDHMDGSINMWKLTAEKLIMITSFESLDVWGKEATVDNTLGQLRLITQSTTADTARAWSGYTGSGIILEREKDYYLQTTVKLDYYTDIVATWGAGNIIDPTDEGYIGFKVTGGKLYAVWGNDGDNDSYEIENITLTNRNVYRIKYQYAESKIEWYINGVKVHETADISNIEDADVTVDYYLHRNTTDFKVMYVYDLVIEKER